MRKRILYAGVILLIILLGILSRRVPAIPLFTGDLLWAMMIFFIMRFLLIDTNARSVALLSFSICCAVEISQIYQDDWINEIRQTLPGRLILGQGFLWSDLIAYGAGVIVGYLIEVTALNRKVPQ
jgi:hypothetical protein